MSGESGYIPEAGADGEAFLAMLLGQLPETAILIVDDELRYQRVSGEGLTYRGLVDWAGRSVAETAAASDVVAVSAAYRRALAGEQNVVVTASGAHRRPIELRCLPLRQGEHPLVFVVARDLTESQGREMAMREVTLQFEQVIRSSPTGIALTAPDGTIALVNDAFSRLFDRAPGSLLDTEAHTLLPMMGARGTNWVSHLIASGRDQLLRHVEFRTAAGPTHATVTAVVLRDSDGAATSVLVNAHDTTEQHRYHEHLAYLATHDSLTGLPNRIEFERLLALHLENCRLSGEEGAVLVLDLDNFREINNSLGHGSGDDLIVAMASVLTRWMRPNDTVSRIGGDEFAVLLAEGDRVEVEADVTALLELVRGGFRNFPHYEEEHLTRRVTVSIGAVAVTTEAVAVGGSRAASELLSGADLAMYDAKSSGRNSYSFFDSTQLLAARISNQSRWSERILAAIDEDRLVLHAQPILDLRTGVVTSLELLVRMIDTDGRLIAPGEFIPVAERSGLAVMLDRWVVGGALEQLARVQLIEPEIRLHVNLSGRSVGDLDFADFIVALIVSTGVRASGLVFEVTETAAVGPIDLAQEFMGRLTALGCTFALDDFGSGYGSFHYLKHLPFTMMKLDGEFVSGGENDPLNRLVMSSLVSIGKGLGMVTIAEYVEDEAALDLVREIGVDGAQGYFVGHPAPLSTFFPALG